MKKLCLVLVLALLLPLMAVSAAQAEDVVTIEYWQYYFESKVALIDELIRNDIEVVVICIVLWLGPQVCQERRAAAPSGRKLLA